MGRFYQTDPVGFSSAVNSYAYATNDPVNKNDPSGTVTDSSGNTLDCDNDFTLVPDGFGGYIEVADIVVCSSTGGPGALSVLGPPSTGSQSSGENQKLTRLTLSRATPNSTSPQCTQLQAQAALIGSQLSQISSALSTAAGFGGLTSTLLGAGEVVGGLDTPLTASAVVTTGFLAYGSVITGVTAGSLKSFAAGNFSPLALEAFNQVVSLAAGLAGNPLSKAIGLGDIKDELGDLAARALGIAEKEHSECS